MSIVVMIFHILACVALILIVLLQTGRGAEMGAAFGGASQTLFGGGGGSTFLTRLTTGAAVVFMLTCLGLSYLSAGPSTKSVMENAPIEKPQGPVLPEATPVPTAPGQSSQGETPAAPTESKPAAAAPAPEASQAQGKAATPAPADQNKPATSETKQ